MEITIKLFGPDYLKMRAFRLFFESMEMLLRHYSATTEKFENLCSELFSHLERWEVSCFLRVQAQERCQTAAACLLALRDEELDQYGQEHPLKGGSESLQKPHVCLLSTWVKTRLQIIERLILCR